MPNVHAQQISTIVNNAIVLLWQQGFIDSAQSKVFFGIVNDIPEAEVAKQHGFAMFQLSADDDRLDFAFPQSMIFRLPRHQVREIAKEIFQQREMVLAELAKMTGYVQEEDEDEDEDMVFSSDLPSLGPEPAEQPSRPRAVDLPSLGPDDE